MRWLVTFLSLFYVSCESAGGKAAKSSEGGIDATTDRQVEYSLYFFGELSRWAKDYAASKYEGLEGTSTTRAGKAGFRNNKKIKTKPGINSLGDAGLAGLGEATPESKSKSVSKFAKIAKFIGKAAPALGVLGFLVPFVLTFFGQQDHTLQIILDQFFEVNEKLDEINSKLDGMEDMITFNTQRAAYIQVESDIENGYRQMNLMFQELKDSKCNTTEECNRSKTKIAERYIEKMEPTDRALHTLFRGLTTPSEFQDSLLKLVMLKSNCDVPRILDVYEKMLFLAHRGGMVSVVLKKLTESETSVLESTNHWMKNMYVFRNQTYKIINHCYSNAVRHVYEDLKKMSGYDLDYVKQHLDKKYDWVSWVSLH